MKNVLLLSLVTLLACSEPAAPVLLPEPVEQTQPQEQVALFKVGDIVDVEGAPEGFVIVVIEDLGIISWMKLDTLEQVEMRGYMLEATAPDGTTMRAQVPEVELKKKQ